MEEEGQQKRLCNVQGHLPTKPRGQNVWSNEQGTEAQMGFRKGSGCTYAIFALRQLSEKVIEHDRELNIVFVDQEKAFDRVSRDKLWQTLQLYNIQAQPLDSIRVIK